MGPPRSAKSTDSTGGTPCSTRSTPPRHDFRDERPHPRPWEAAQRPHGTGRDGGHPPRPAPEHETVWRHTFLAQFTNSADLDALQRFGGFLYTATLSAGYVGSRDRLIAADDLDAVADDLDALGAALREIAEVQDHLVLGPAKRDLCREARDWEGKLGDLAHEIRCRVREVEGESEPVSDRPLSEDVREAERIAKRLADYHPDPRARRIYRQLVETGNTKRKGKGRS